MDNFNDYIKVNKTEFNRLSLEAYSGEINSSSVEFSFDYNSIYKEVCFARLYGQMFKDERGKTFSSNYIMRLPYSHLDKNEDLHDTVIEYVKFFEELKKLIEGTYKLSIYNTQYNNVKLVTMENVINLPKNLDYCLTLIMFTMIRGVEGENNRNLGNYFSVNKKLSGDLVQYLLTTSKQNRGSHHNINDALDSLVNKVSTEFLDKIFTSYIDVLRITFGKDGLVYNPKYFEYFEEIFDSKSNQVRNTMQTKAFDYINKTTNKLLLEG